MYVLYEVFMTFRTNFKIFLYGTTERKKKSQFKNILNEMRDGKQMVYLKYILKNQVTNNILNLDVEYTNLTPSHTHRQKKKQKKTLYCEMKSQVFTSKRVLNK